MRDLILASFLIFNSLPAHAAEVPTNAQYASTIADIFAQLKTPDDFKKLMRLKTRAEDLKLLEADLSELKTVPQVTAKSASVMVEINGEFENVTVVDAPKGLYQYKGIEIDLSPDRPLQERLDQIEQLRAGKSSALWNFLLPSAHARGGKAIASALGVLFAGVGGATAVDYQNFMDAGKAASRLNWLCQAIKTEKPNLRGVFVAKEHTFDRSIEDEIDYDGNWKLNKLPKGITNWEPSVRKTLESNQKKYCEYDNWLKGVWHKVRKLNAFNYTSESREETCEEIKQANQCFNELRKKKAPSIYKIQHDQIVRWLQAIDPKVSETQIANEIRIETTETAAKGKPKTLVREKGGAAR